MVAPQQGVGMSETVGVADLSWAFYARGRWIQVRMRWEVPELERPAFQRIVQEEAAPLTRSSANLEPVRTVKAFAKRVERAGNWKLVEFKVGGLAEVAHGEAVLGS